jgi:hypothetical protein
MISCDQILGDYAARRPCRARLFPRQCTLLVFTKKIFQFASTDQVSDNEAKKRRRAWGDPARKYNSRILCR